MNNFWYTYDGHPYNPNGSGQFAGENGYLNLPPAQSLAYMCDTMTHFMYYNNDFTVQGIPTTPGWYYNYLKNIWGDGTHTTYGGNGYGPGSPTNYMYPGTSARSIQWSEVSSGDPSGDRRGVSSTGPFTLKANTEKSLDLALVFAQSPTGDNLTSVSLLNPYIDTVKSFYNRQSYTCNESLLGIPTVASNAIVNKVLVYPNPASTEVIFKMSSGENKYIRISDITGRVLATTNVLNNLAQLNLSAYTSGIYLYQVFNRSGNIVDRGKFSVVK